MENRTSAVQNSGRHKISQENFYPVCEILTKRDPDLARVIADFGYPGIWFREPGFPTLVRILLEQQVSLSSARAAYEKLLQQTGQITPASVLSLSDAELKSCYFSRQKAGYVRHLATSIMAGELNLEEFGRLDDETARNRLKSVKGIGDWTADIYLLMAMGRPDIFPVGDLAMVRSLCRIKGLRDQPSKLRLEKISSPWKPFRSVATMILWHAYLEEKKKNLS